MKYYETDEVKDFSGGKPLGVWIGNLGKYNEGALVGEWVRLPSSYEEIQSVMERIGIGSRDEFGQPYEEWFIADYDCYVKGMSKYLGEYENLDELNWLAGRIEDMNDYEYETFLAAIELGDDIRDAKGLINVAYNLDEYDTVQGVFNDSELGYYWIHDAGCYDLESMGNLASYIDYDSFGADIRLEEGGCYTEMGYIAASSRAFPEHYGGDINDIPSEYRVMSKPENYLENAEVQLEDDYGMIDGIINNAPKESVKDRLKDATERSKIQEIKNIDKAVKKEEISL